jgi:protein involved in polysaccharide export with SLBB domain
VAPPGWEETENFYLARQDSIVVYSLDTVRPEIREVWIYGVVKAPGRYPLQTNMTW